MRNRAKEVAAAIDNKISEIQRAIKTADKIALFARACQADDIETLCFLMDDIQADPETADATAARLEAQFGITV